MVAPTATLAARTITRVSARAFVHPKVAGGGNPVDLFLARPSSSPSDSVTLPPDVRSRLAQSCEWESVIAHLPSASAGEEGQRPVLSFHMPSGEEVSFCAHAALGAASVLGQEASDDEGSNNTARVVEFTTTTDDSVQSVSISTDTGEAELKMSAKLTESDIPDFITLGHVRDALGLRMEDVSLGGLPSYINSSIARNKTLFPMLDEKRLQVGPQNPKDPDEWKRLCDKIDSTGVYLYSPVDDDSMEDAKTEGNNAETKEEKQDGSEEAVLRFECRQFPRASGYPEDPATGIAAAALAASLRKRGFGAPVDDKDTRQYRYEFYQGTSMGHRSKIGVRFDHDCDVKSKDKDMDIYISGLVDISSREEVALPSS